MREEHPMKARSPMIVTPSGIVMAVREEHPQKVSTAIDLTPCANVTSVSSSSSMKLSTPEYTADLGILGRIWERFGKDDSNRTDSARGRVRNECLDGEKEIES